MSKFAGYPKEEYDDESQYFRYDDKSPEAEHHRTLPTDDGTMQQNADELAEAVVGHKIVGVVKAPPGKRYYQGDGTVLVLDDGTKVTLRNTDDCCAHTDLVDIITHIDKIHHVITGVGTTEGFTRWHIYADFGDVMELKVSWSCGNPFYYGYGFDIEVEPYVELLKQNPHPKSDKVEYA
jgi:hypothetical protein